MPRPTIEATLPVARQKLLVAAAVTFRAQGLGWAETAERVSRRYRATPISGRPLARLVELHSADPQASMCHDDIVRHANERRSASVIRWLRSAEGRAWSRAHPKTS